MKSKNNIIINIVKMLLLNNINFLNITEDDYNILLNSDINFELLHNDNLVRYVETFGKYMTIFLKQQKDILDELSSYTSCNNLIDLDIDNIIKELDIRNIMSSIQFMILLDTKGGHYMIRSSPIIKFAINITAMEINRILLKYNDDNLNVIKSIAEKIISILCNIDTINIDYTTYKFAWEGINENIYDS